MNSEKLSEIYLAGGCYWGTQHFLKQIYGVVSTKVGFANGTTENPSYREVCTDTTGHAETVQVVYDSAKLTLKKLLELYFETIDPTSINRQGNDVGKQYRTGIFFADEKDLPIIQSCLQELQKSYVKPLRIAVEPFKCFYEAEESHQDYLSKNPYGYCHINKSLFDMARRANLPMQDGI